MIFRVTESSGAWSALPGFVVSGFICSLPAALLPAWGYDISGDFASAGRYFLAMALGTVAAGAFLRQFARLVSVRVWLVAGCATACVALAALGFTPNRPVWQMSGIALLGAAAGLLHAGLFRALLPSWERSPALTVNSAGLFFGAGAITSTLLVAATFYAWPVDRILLVLAAVPAAFGLIFFRYRGSPSVVPPAPAIRKQFRSTAAILFSSLLFFQFGSEWSIAGWLPLFLIHRLAVSPAGALLLLAFYFAALTAGRLAAYLVLRRVRHVPLLLISASLSVFACGVLALTENLFGAVLSILFLGIGFAPIYPILAAWIGRRFSYYHPGFFNGIFSLALAGGLLAPWLLGELAGRTGIWVVTTLPAAGTCMVMLILSLIRLHEKVTGE